MPSKATEVAALLGKLAFAVGGDRTVGGRVGATLADHNQAIIQADLIEEERKRQEKNALKSSLLGLGGSLIGGPAGGAAGGLLGKSGGSGSLLPGAEVANFEFIEELDEFGNPLPGFGHGGAVAGGGNARVGEFGPETVNLPPGATVQPAAPGGPNAVPAASGASQSPVGALVGELAPHGGTFLGGSNQFFQQLDEMPLLQLGLQTGAAAVRGRTVAAASAPAPVSAIERTRGGFAGTPAPSAPVSGTRQFQSNLRRRFDQFAQNPAAPGFINTVANSFPQSAQLFGDPNNPDSFAAMFGGAFGSRFRSVGV